MELTDKHFNKIIILRWYRNQILSNYSYNQYKTLIIELCKIKYNKMIIIQKLSSIVY